MVKKGGPGALVGAQRAGIGSCEQQSDTKHDAPAPVASTRKLSRREKLRRLYAEELERERQYTEKWGGGGDLIPHVESLRGSL